MIPISRNKSTLMALWLGLNLLVLSLDSGNMNTRLETLSASMISWITLAALPPIGALASHFSETSALYSELCFGDDQGEHPQPGFSATPAA